MSIWDRLREVPQAGKSEEDEAAELIAAGWKMIPGTKMWSDPIGCIFAGPHGAWRIMQARKEKKP